MYSMYKVGRRSVYVIQVHKLRQSDVDSCSVNYTFYYISYKLSYFGFFFIKSAFRYQTSSRRATVINGMPVERMYLHRRPIVGVMFRVYFVLSIISKQKIKFNNPTKYNIRIAKLQYIM